VVDLRQFENRLFEHFIGTVATLYRNDIAGKSVSTFLSVVSVTDMKRRPQTTVILWMETIREVFRGFRIFRMPCTGASCTTACRAGDLSDMGDDESSVQIVSSETLVAVGEWLVTVFNLE
jgi:hypothetical protein